MTAATQEGVIKFQLDFRDAHPPAADHLRELNAWRWIFRGLGLIGQDPARYGGLGFGNLSRRLPGQDGEAFLISGTQTGLLPYLEPEHYATVLHCSAASNALEASGRIRPSSEALSHGVLYQCCPTISWVMHLHSPAVFNRRQQLSLPGTDPAAAYGSPEMAAEIQRLALGGDRTAPGLLVMTGHQDGILAYGPSAEATGSLVIATLAAAMQLS